MERVYDVPLPFETALQRCSAITINGDVSILLSSRSYQTD
jgi:hypothetical protein